MTLQQTIDEYSRQLDILSRQTERASQMWNTNPKEARRLLDEVSRRAHGISQTLENIVK